MPTLSSDEVAHLARLSRLALSPAEQERLGSQLEVILSAVARVSEIAAADVPPTTHAVPITNVVRADVVQPCLSRDEVLAAAPSSEDGRFRVPRILEDDQ